ncbi:uncharacterized protein LOC120682191 isoform X10 [Panicum virgatum]|uniref:uncharacterized protein LOC120682191 isoform X10 n=1 Tax=Panicum virgatum TaxID=38727 RepID=UPI0019D60153|nr:uncharacterized protein LOC120682191 isoform X10 [Panicum virgatum]
MEEPSTSENRSVLSNSMDPAVLVYEFCQEVEVFRRQLELAKELERPVSVHCVRAFGDLLEILKQTGPFPAGMKSTKAKQMLKSIPLDRILLETDAPDALPKLDNISVSLVPVHSSDADTEKHHKDSESQAATASNESLNHPENIHIDTSFSRFWSMWHHCLKCLRQNWRSLVSRMLPNCFLILAPKFTLKQEISDGFAATLLTASVGPCKRVSFRHSPAPDDRSFLCDVMLSGQDVGASYCALTEGRIIYPRIKDGSFCECRVWLQNSTVCKWRDESSELNYVVIRC